MVRLREQSSAFAPDSLPAGVRLWSGQWRVPDSHPPPCGPLNGQRRMIRHIPEDYAAWLFLPELELSESLKGR
jgi:hypothetical protein